MTKHNSDIPNDAGASGSEQDAAPDTPRNEPPVPQSDAHGDEPAPRPDSHPRPAPDADEVRPDQQEELGPAEGLLHASAVEAKSEVTDDPEAEAEAERLGIEAEGVEAAQIFSIMLATGITLALAVVGVFFLVEYYSDAETVERSREMAYTEIQEVRNRATELLTQPGRTEDTYRLPITEAMGLVTAQYAEQGGDARPAPDHFRTIYIGGYFDDSGFDATSAPEDVQTDVAEEPQALPLDVQGEADETEEPEQAEEPESVPAEEQQEPEDS